MNLRTHIIVGMGLAGFAVSTLDCSIGCYILATSISALHHPIIDYASHRHGRRTILFHSIIGAVFLALATSIPFLLFLPPGIVFPLVVASMASCVSHWLLDLITIGGVYVVRGRVSLKLFRYDDPLPNISFQAMGFLLLLYSLLVFTS
ncbi:MAG: metal-dependent hydrolase [Desulfurococcales archaeon]|nr:metal-dependent hydrolase [Desulfurococcales archaeon]